MHQILIKEEVQMTESLRVMKMNSSQAVENRLMSLRYGEILLSIYKCSLALIK